MHLLPPDSVYLDRALSLAQVAAAFASPNPTVGCVLARDGVVLGEGAHFHEVRDHAEIAALKDAALAGRNVTGATAYVTLEPCSHHGRTGPCADALVAAGISRCVVATVDPNPLVRGRGLAKLQAAKVQTDLLSEFAQQTWQARRLNDAFAFSIQHGRPFVTLKAAVSRDGKLAPAASQRNGIAPVWLTGAAARQDVQKLRHQSDAILTGIGTVLADDPSLTDRTGLPRRRPLLRVVLDSELRLPVTAKLASPKGGDVLVFTSSRAPTDREAALRASGMGVQRVQEKGSALDLGEIFAILAGKQIRSLLVEGGARLNAAFLQQDLVDRFVLYTAPVELGANALPFAGDVSLAAVVNRLTSSEEGRFLNGEGEDVRLTGYLHDPWRSLAH